MLLKLLMLPDQLVQTQIIVDPPLQLEGQLFSSSQRQFEGTRAEEEGERLSLSETNWGLSLLPALLFSLSWGRGNKSRPSLHANRTVRKQPQVSQSCLTFVTRLPVSRRRKDKKAEVNWHLEQIKLQAESFLITHVNAQAVGICLWLLVAWPPGPYWE